MEGDVKQNEDDTQNHLALLARRWLRVSVLLFAVIVAYCLFCMPQMAKTFEDFDVELPALSNTVFRIGGTRLASGAAILMLVSLGSHAFVHNSLGRFVLAVLFVCLWVAFIGLLVIAVELPHRRFVESMPELFG